MLGERDSLSIMGALFGKKKKPPREDRVDAKDRAKLDLKVQRDKLKKYKKKVSYLAAIPRHRCYGPF